VKILYILPLGITWYLESSIVGISERILPENWDRFHRQLTGWEVSCSSGTDKLLSTGACLSDQTANVPSD
jgi:hypothetical protein